MKLISTPCIVASLLIALSLSVAVGVKTYSYQSRFSDTPEEIREVETLILGYVASITEAIRIVEAKESTETLYRLRLPNWPLSSYELSSLTYKNRQKAEAMILLAYRKPPPALETLEKWKSREVDAMLQWEIAEPSFAIKEAMYYGGITFAGLPFIYIAMLIIIWLWYFVLLRIAELINSFKGNPPNQPLQRNA